MKIYHTETQADYGALMVELERQGCRWASGDGMTELAKNWKRNSSETCVRVDKKVVSYDKKSYYKEDYPHIPITKYKAKAEEKMKFTKSNIEGLVNKYFDDNVGECPGNLIAEIYAMDDTPEKAVVPKCFDEWYKEIIVEYPIPDNAKTFALWKLCRQGFGHGYEDVHGKRIPYETDLGEWLFKNKMLAIDAVLNGYTIAPEPLYAIPLENLVTSDGVQQYLSYDATGQNYFASRPQGGLKQKYTNDELQDVPERYKAFAVPVEVEK